MNSNPQTEKDAWRATSFLALTFVAMAVWPLLGILLVGFSELGNITEAALLFGGITLILLTLISLALPLSNTIFVIAIITIWLFIWIGPAMWLTSRSPTRRTQIIVCCVLSCISLGQAALGAVLIIGGNA